MPAAIKAFTTQSSVGRNRFQLSPAKKTFFLLLLRRVGIQVLRLLKLRTRRQSQVLLRVARRYIFRPKVAILVSFERPWNGTFWYFLRPFGIFFSNLVNVMAIGYIL
jgi:hypothetical protein